MLHLSIEIKVKDGDDLIGIFTSERDLPDLLAVWREICEVNAEVCDAILSLEQEQKE